MPNPPNPITPGERVIRILLSLGLIAYGLHGLLTDDFYVPGKYHGTHLHGTPARLMVMAMFCAAAVLLTVVAQHYDSPGNERYYRVCAFLGRIAGWAFFVSALLWDLYFPNK